jgi:hypothetical protein
VIVLPDGACPDADTANTFCAGAKDLRVSC